MQIRIPGLVVVLAVFFGSLTGRAEAPPGAAELGYSKCVIDEKPVPTDIAPGANGPYKWFSGQWWYAEQRRPPLELYGQEGEALAIHQGGDLVSAPTDFSAGRLPALPGDKGFYVEFDVWLSDDDPDHFPAVWLMPVEHNRNKDDHYDGDPVDFQRWTELDVMERMPAKGPGLVGSIHAWYGIHPQYRKVSNRNNVSPTPIDFTQRHRFGASYDPLRQQVAWWVDGVKQMSIGTPVVPEVAAKQHFYLIMSADSHLRIEQKRNKNPNDTRKPLPYKLYVGGVRAFVPESSPLPAVK